MTVNVDEKESSSEFKREPGSSSKRNHDGEEQEKDSADNTDHIPSTSGSSKHEPSNEMKIYKKSITYIQYNWCRQEPKFLKLRDELTALHK